MKTRKKNSSGLIMYRFRNSVLEILAGHMGGPYWIHKEIGAWSIPKGEHEDNEEPFEAAKREFFEETGIKPSGDFIKLGSIREANGKTVNAWAFEGDFDPEKFKSNTFKMEWPKGSGRISEFPEIDKVEWFSSKDAKRKVIKGQEILIDELIKILQYDPSIEG